LAIAAEPVSASELTLAVAHVHRRRLFLEAMKNSRLKEATSGSVLELVVVSSGGEDNEGTARQLEVA
jgi:hypothetical protein